MRYTTAAWIALLSWTAVVSANEPAQDFAPIESAVVDYVMAHSDPHTRYEIVLNPLDTRLRLPVCGNPIDVFAPPGYRPMGTATLGVRCNQDRSWIIYVTAQIKAFRRIAVLANAVMRGTNIKPGDVVLREQDVGSLGGGYFFDEQQVVGKLAKRSLNAGMVISPNQLTAPRWVARGQVVTLFVDSGGLQVRAQGEAMADAAENDLVKVRNVLSGKIVDGFVTAPGTVRVKM
jgi:flagellar basal body P-ring formation protein FlgA